MSALKAWLIATAVTLVLLWLVGTLPPNESSDWPWFAGIVGVVSLFSALAYYGSEGNEDKDLPKWLIVPGLLVWVAIGIIGIGGGLVLIYIGITGDDAWQALYGCGGGAMLVLATVGWLFSAD